MGAHREKTQQKLFKIEPFAKLCRRAACETTDFGVAVC
jgi:hypothetical protein